jgi:hypothetical protein
VLVINLIFITLALITTIVTAIPALAVSAKEEPLDQKLIDNDILLRKKLDNIANGVDLALAGKKLVSTPNRTQITIRNQVYDPEGGPFQYKPHFDLRLNLPNVEKEWLLKFSTYDENQESRGINRDRLKTAPIRDEYATSVGLLQKLGEVNAEFEPRLEYRDGLQMSYIARFTSTATNKLLTLHPEAQLFAKSDSGVGEFFGINCDLPIYKTIGLTIINEEQYLDQVNVFTTNNGFTVGFAYNDSMSQGTSLLFESSSRPNYQLDTYSIASGFTHKLYKNIFHYNITPYLSFPRNLDFKGSPGVNAEVDIIF